MTPLEDKLKQKQRKGLANLCSSAKSAWSFQNKRTWHLIYKHLGFDEIAINQGEMALNKDKPVSFQELVSYLKSLEDDLERKLNEPKQEQAKPLLPVTTNTQTQPSSGVRDAVEQPKEALDNT